jgi:uncharacterized membrane protein YdbT with pleckstrin-like domain
MEPGNASVDESKLHRMVVLQDGETVVCDIRRHPIGIVSSYVVAVIFIIVAAVLAFVFVPKLSGTAPQDVNIVYIGLGLAVIAIVAVVGINTSVYSKNRWIVTSDSLTQITQRSLMAQQVSQLSMESLEDVTVEQNGFLQSMFNFGTLHVETAGEHSKFVFPFCPDPNGCARSILAARETYLKGEQYGKANKE